MIDFPSNTVTSNKKIAETAKTTKPSQTSAKAENSKATLNFSPISALHSVEQRSSRPPSQGFVETC
jgi:hypothetical protein